MAQALGSVGNTPTRYAVSTSVQGYHKCLQMPSYLPKCLHPTTLAEFQHAELLTHDT